jgi:hypothetical protein
VRAELVDQPDAARRVAKREQLFAQDSHANLRPVSCCSGVSAMRFSPGEIAANPNASHSRPRYARVMEWKLRSLGALGLAAGFTLVPFGVSADTLDQPSSSPPRPKRRAGPSPSATS